jgi:hypothetical protein
MTSTFPKPGRDSLINPVFSVTTTELHNGEQTPITNPEDQSIGSGDEE